MVFSSVTFLFFFLPLVLALYAVAGRRLRNTVLLAASLAFLAVAVALFVWQGSGLARWLVLLTWVFLTVGSWERWRAGREPPPDSGPSIPSGPAKGAGSKLT